MLNKSIRFPVGRVEFLAIRPCSFSEFLNAVGENLLAESIGNRRLPAAAHGKAMQLFNKYAVVGGMPEIVAEYAENKDIISLYGIFDSLLTSYRDDVVKYARNETMEHVIGLILQEGWKYAAQTISMTGFAGSAYKAREMGEAFRTLEKTMLLELCYPSTGAMLPIQPETKRQPKLLWLDTGIVNYVAGIQSEVFGSSDIMDVWRGRVAEQVAAQELYALDQRVTYRRGFWVRDKKGSDAEVDFLVQHKNMVVPIEIKSGHNAHLKSLHGFIDTAPHKVAIRIWSKPYEVSTVKTKAGKEFQLISLPFYYISKLHEWVEQEIVGVNDFE
jgi:predicted AAA+ superfamily ATPase